MIIYSEENHHEYLDQKDQNNSLIHSGYDINNL